MSMHTPFAIYYNFTFFCIYLMPLSVFVLSVSMNLVEIRKIHIGVERQPK